MNRDFVLNKTALLKYIIFFIGIVLFIIGVLSGYAFPNAIALYLMVVSFFICYISRKNSLCLIISIFALYFNYSICFSSYLHIVKDTVFTSLSNSSVSNYGIHVLLLFWLIFLLCINSDVELFNRERDDWFWVSSNNYIASRFVVYMINVLLIYILITGFVRPDKIGDRGSPTPLYEYSCIFIIIAYYYGNHHKDCKVITSVVLFLFAGQNFIYGGRISGLQLLAIFYVFCLSHKYMIVRLTPIIITAFILLSIIGENRGAWMYDEISFSNTFNNLKNRFFTLDTAYSSYYTSLTFLLVEGTTTAFSRLTFFLYFIKQVFLGGSSLGEYDLTAYSHKYYVHYYGGVLPFYFHFYLGWVGVLCIAVFVVFLFNKASKIKKSDSGLKKCIIVYYVCTIPRWYLYSPSQITRGLLLLTIVYYCISGVIRLLSKGDVYTYE